MTAEEIRKFKIHAEMNAYAQDALKNGKQISAETAAIIVQLVLLRELTAQIAEFNERCAVNCKPPESKFK